MGMGMRECDRRVGKQGTGGAQNFLLDHARLTPTKERKEEEEWNGRLVIGLN